MNVMKKGKRVVFTFQESWLKEYTWLLYSPLQGGGYCKYCILFNAKLGKGYFGTLVKSPFRNFSKAKGKDGYFACHENHEYYQGAMVRGKSFLNTCIRPDTIIDRRGVNYRP